MTSTASLLAIDVLVNEGVYDALRRIETLPGKVVQVIDD